MSLSVPTRPQLSASSVLEQIACRIRPCGLFVLMLNDSGVHSYDLEAGEFFLNEVLPQTTAAEGDRLRERFVEQRQAAPILVEASRKGILFAILPADDRKQLPGRVVLAAKTQDFATDDPAIDQLARRLPSYSAEALSQQAGLVAGMLRDCLRVSVLEKEVNNLSTQLSNTYEELSLIYQLSSGMKINRQPADFFRNCCLNVMDVIGSRGMGVALIGENSRLHQPALYGSVALPPLKLHRLADDLLVELRARKTAILCNDLSSDHRFSAFAEFAGKLLAVPLMREDRILGCLFALDKDQEDFNTVDSKLLISIANESTIYLENAMLFEDSRGLMMGLLRSLTSAVDAKDTYTCGHSERVALLSRYIALQAGLTEQTVERIYMAGLLHDVGKIGISEAVLQKTGRLDADEFEEIKKHPEIGARILRDVKQISDVIPGVMHHHERYDGMGYPARLAGEKIPLMGRIICIADCFDAMTSSRTYREAMPLEDALAEISRCAGTQFDPVLADAFLQISPQTLQEVLKDHRQQVLQISNTARLRVA